MDNPYRISLLSAAKNEVEKLESTGNESSSQIIECLSDEVVKLETKLREVRSLCNKWEKDVLRGNLMDSTRDCLEFCASELSAMLNEVKI